MATVWPLIGRAEELRRITAALVGTGQNAGVVVAGDPGVGKSRLAGDALRQIPPHYAVRWTVATASARPLPLGVFAEWIGEPGAESMSLVRDVIEALTAAPDGGQVIVGIDDAHLLDDLSAFVVHQLVQRRLAKVIVTLRNREPAPDAITTLWKDSYLERLELQPLSAHESDALVASVLGGPLESTAAQQLWQLTRGNVLFLRHLVEQELAAHRLYNDDGMWLWNREPMVSTTLADLIDSQMGALSDEVGEVIDLVSVGEPFDFEVLVDLVGAKAIEDAELQGLITLVNDPDPVVRVTHPLYGEMRRGRGSAQRLRRLRGRIVLALAESPVRDSRELIHRAMLHLDSDLPPDGALFTDAAGAAMQLFDPVLAEKLAGAARRAGAGYDAMVIHQFALHLIGGAIDCERMHAQTPHSEFTADQNINLAVYRAGNLLWGLGLPEQAIAVLDATRAEFPSASNSRLEGFRAVIDAGQGHADTAIDFGYAVAASPDEFTAMMADFALTIALGHAGRTREVVDITAHGYQLAATSVEASPLVFGLTEFHVEALLLAGYQTEAEVETRRWAQQTADIPAVHGAYAASIIGRTELSAGRVHSAVQWLEKAMRALRRFGSTKFLAVGMCRSDLVIAHAVAGDRGSATSELTALKADGNTFGFMESRFLLAEAWVFAVEGAMNDAVSQCLRAAAAAQSRGHFAQEVRCLQAATRFGDHTVAPRLAQLCAVVDGPRVEAAAAHAAALAANDPDALVAASRQLEQIGDALSAADAAAQAAAIYRRRGRRGPAVMALQRIERMTQLCENADTPALRTAAEARPLTPRQREIFALVAQGLSNKQIADRLGMSVRTVEGHRLRAKQR